MFTPELYHMRESICFFGISNYRPNEFVAHQERQIPASCWRLAVDYIKASSAGNVNSIRVSM